MCPLRLLNEGTSYRPFGMLDRDQRTAFTISKKCRCPSMILTTTTSCITSVNATGELNYKNLKQKCSNTSSKCKNMITTVGMPKDLSECKCDCQQLNNSVALNLWKENTSMASRRKYPIASSGYYQSQPKLVNCLLVFICIWFVSINHTCAYPLSKDMRSENYPDALRCKVIQDALNRTIGQSHMTASYIGNLLNNYTQLQFKKEPKDVHEVWKHHPAHFRYNVDLVKELPLDYDVELNQTYFPHLLIEGPPSEEELEREIQRIYILLQTLNKVFTVITNDYTVNETASQILHHLNYEVDTFNSNKHMFKEQLRYSSSDITELEIAMSSLNIQNPHLAEVVIDTIDRFTGEWIATREHLKVHRYIQGIFRILLKRCS